MAFGRLALDRLGRLAAALSPAAFRGANGAGGAKMVHGSSPMWSWFLPGTKFDYEAAAGGEKLLKSSVVVAALCWMMRTFPEAPAVVERLEDAESDQWRIDPGHRLGRMLKSPNPFYGGHVLWMATIMEFAFGEAFWIKIRNAVGRVIQLWWVPRALIKPMWDAERRPDTFITHYRYSPAGRQIDLRVEDVVHFRFGMDPADIRRGFSPLAALVREVYTDEQAANFTASVLRNLGVIGVVLSPTEGTVGAADVEELKKYVKENFTEDGRGQAMAFARPTKMEVAQYNLQGFDMGPIRDIAEERVSATIGIPAAVIGFGTGLQQTKVGATMRELIQLAWSGALIPLQGILADEMDRSLLPEFGGGEGQRTAFDVTKVRALWEDVGEKSKRVLEQLKGTAIDLAEARRALGYAVKPEHQGVWFRQAGIVAIAKPGDPAPVAPNTPAGEAPPALVDANGNPIDPESGAKARALVGLKAEENGMGLTVGKTTILLQPQITVEPADVVVNVPSAPPPS